MITFTKLKEVVFKIYNITEKQALVKSRKSEIIEIRALISILAHNFRFTQEKTEIGLNKIIDRSTICYYINKYKPINETEFQRKLTLCKLELEEIYSSSFYLSMGKL